MVTWLGGPKIADRIKIASQPPFQIMLDCADGPSVITRVLKSARGRRRGRCDYGRPESSSVRRTWPAIAGSEDGGTWASSQGSWEVCRSWKRPRNRDPASISRGKTAQLTSWVLSSEKPCQTHNPQNYKIHHKCALCQVITFVVFVTEARGNLYPELNHHFMPPFIKVVETGCDSSLFPWIVAEF